MLWKFYKGLKLQWKERNFAEQPTFFIVLSTLEQICSTCRKKHFFFVVNFSLPCPIFKENIMNMKLNGRLKLESNWSKLGFKLNLIKFCTELKELRFAPFAATKAWRENEPNELYHAEGCVLRFLPSPLVCSKLVRQVFQKSEYGICGSEVKPD